MLIFISKKRILLHDLCLGRVTSHCWVSFCFMWTKFKRCYMPDKAANVLILKFLIFSFFLKANMKYIAIERVNTGSLKSENDLAGKFLSSLLFAPGVRPRYCLHST